MSTYNILSVQINPKLGKKQSNLDKVKYFIEKNADLKPDLIIMPEFFNTGIVHSELDEFAEVDGSSETVEFLSKLAKRYKTYICCGAIFEKDGDKIYNTSFLLDRNGDVVAKYRKIHLFNYMGGNEGLRITEGKDLVVVDTELGKIGMSICWDIRYPMMFHDLMKQGAEIIICPAAMCQPFQQEWFTLNQARAMDNAVYFVSSTMVGAQGVSGFVGVGHSMIVNPNGEILATAGSTEGCAFAKIDMNALHKLRKAFPVTEFP